MLPPEPYESALLADLKRLLQQITPSNGYHTNAGEHVFTADERLDPGEGDSIVLILDDGEEELVEQDGYRRHVRLKVDVQIFVPVESGDKGRVNARALARQALTDVRRAALAGLSGDSFKVRPVELRLEGRTLLPLGAGDQWQVALQPIAVQHLEEFQSV